MPRDTPALSAYDHFATMVFAQLTYRKSRRDIEVCLKTAVGCDPFVNGNRTNAAEDSLAHADRTIVDP